MGTGPLIVALVLALHRLALGSVLQVSSVADPDFTCRSLGLEGECEEVPSCICMCFKISSESTSVQAAYFGELGYELVLYAPYIHYLQTLGKLSKTLGPPGSGAFNFFSPNHTELPFNRRWCPGLNSNRDPHAATAYFSFDEWIPPNFKEAYQHKLPMVSDRPLLVLHNKYNIEWGEPPVNFIAIPTLMRLIKMLKGQYTIVYMRPYVGQKLQGYVGDQNDDMEFNDHEEIKRHHPEVHLAHELLEQHPEMHGYNEFQLALHAQAEAFISVLGGNAVISSYFAGTNIIYAVKGQEASNREFQDLYPRLAADGHGRVFQAHDYDELLALAEQLFVNEEGLEM